MEPVGGVISVAGFMVLRCNRPVRTFSLHCLSNRGMVMEGTLSNRGVAALSNMRETLGPRVLIVTSRGGPITITNMVNNRCSKVVSSAAAVIFRSTVFGNISMEEATGTLKVEARTSTECRGRLSTANYLHSLGETLRLIRRLSTNSVINNIISYSRDSGAPIALPFRPR